MATESKELPTQEVEKQEITTNGTERTRARKAYVPRADIFETGNEIIVVADMPGVDENSVDITLEKNVLSINGLVEPAQFDSHSLAYAEYEVGDYFRRFTLSDEVDQDNIQATVNNGVLHLHLPKAGPAQARKIAVKAA
jgi:HSP20 family molecular chaperone IbpA